MAKKNIKVSDAIYYKRVYQYRLKKLQKLIEKKKLENKEAGKEVNDLTKDKILEANYHGRIDTINWLFTRGEYHEKEE